MNDPQNNNNGPSIKEKIIMSYKHLKDAVKTKWLHFKNNRLIKKDSTLSTEEVTHDEASPNKSPLNALKMTFVNAWTKWRVYFTELRDNQQLKN